MGTQQYGTVYIHNKIVVRLKILLTAIFIFAFPNCADVVNLHFVYEYYIVLPGILKVRDYFRLL